MDDAPSRNQFIQGLWSLIDCNDRASLASLARDERSSSVARALAGHAMAHFDAAASREVLHGIALGPRGGDGFVLAIEGLRHIESLSEWLELLIKVAPSIKGNGRALKAVTRAWLLATGFGTDILLNCEVQAWHESNLVGNLRELNHRAAWLAATSNLDEAIRVATTMARLYPKDTRGPIMLAGLSIRAERYNDAIDASTRALAINEHHPKALNFRSFAYLKRREYHLALKDLDHAIQLEPNDQAARSNRSHCYSALGRIAEAAADELILLRLKTIEQQNVTDTGAFESVPDTEGALAIPEQLMSRALQIFQELALPQVAADLFVGYARSPQVSREVRQQAIALLSGLQLRDALGELALDLALQPSLRYLAASLFLRDEQLAPRENDRGLSQHGAVVDYLWQSVLDPAVGHEARTAAARELSSTLVVENLFDLLKELSNRDIHSSPSALSGAMPVATILVQAIGNWRRFDLLYAMASDTVIHPALRELCCQIYSTYNKGGAIRLLEGLRVEPDIAPSVLKAVEDSLRSLSGDRRSEAIDSPPNVAKTQKSKAPYQRVERNQLCPCGSGKKYKHCHGILT